MDNFGPDRRCGCIPPKPIEPCRNPGILGYIMIVVLLIFFLCSFGETLWSSFLRIFQRPVCSNYGKKKKGTKTLMNNIEVWKSDQNIFSESVKDRRYISNILYRNFIRNKCFTNSRLLQLSNVDWEGIFYSLKKSLRITSETDAKQTDVDCETDLVSLTYLKTEEESNNAKEEQDLEENKIDIPKKQKYIDPVPSEPDPIISGSPKSNSSKKRPRNRTIKAKIPFVSCKTVENETGLNNNDNEPLDSLTLFPVPREKNEHSRPYFNSKNEKMDKSVQPSPIADVDVDTNQNVISSSYNSDSGKKTKTDDNIILKSESICSIKKSYVLPKAVYRKHLHPKCYTMDEAIWKSNFRSKEANVGAINHVFRATEEDFDVVEIENEEFFQSIRFVRYYQCEFNGKIWEVSQWQPNESQVKLACTFWTTEGISLKGQGFVLMFKFLNSIALYFCSLKPRNV